MEAKGGKHSLGTSPICEAEKAALKLHVATCKAMGPIDSEAKAREYRTALVVMFPNLAAAFDEYKLAH